MHCYDPERLLAHANACRDLAAKATDPVEQRAWLDIARKCERAVNRSLETPAIAEPGHRPEGLHAVAPVSRNGETHEDPPSADEQAAPRTTAEWLRAGFMTAP
ncbi:MAG: hypothetical protein AB7F35_18160 [Acetobacteraceae bacterium]